MQVVGLYLQKEAVKDLGNEKDLFARSAYNRYYYSAFLTTRSLFANLNPDWATLPHKSYPEVLNGKIVKRLSEAKSRARKNDDHELVSILDAAIRAAKALASLMEKANGVRVVADYHPAEQVEFKDTQRFSLKQIDITEAHGWLDQVVYWNSAIANAWKQINV